ncbi:MAG: glycosyltransferase [Gammaproteobacteria bacterium]|nr:glycosyltransferase [Gammaproteobacteria bacterium]
MKVLLLAPEQRGPCGVLEYSLRLAAALQALGVRVTIARGERKGRLSVCAVAAQARALKPDIVHVQYPMARYGSSLMPHWVAQLPRCRTVVTLHEFSQAHLLRRIAGLAFSRADALVFTNAFERAAFGRWYPWSRGRGHVIPIGSNIPWLSAQGARDRDEVCYFGLIRPDKGSGTLSRSGPAGGGLGTAIALSGTGRGSLWGSALTASRYGKRRVGCRV